MMDLNLGETEAGEKLQTVESAEDVEVDEKNKENGSSSRVHMELENLSATLTEGFRISVMETLAGTMNSLRSCTVKHVS